MIVPSRRIFAGLRGWIRLSLPLLGLAMVVLLAAAGAVKSWSTLRAAGGYRPPSPSQSSSIALSDNDHFLVNVNPDANSISVFNTESRDLYKVAEIEVGREPASVAADPWSRDSF